MVHCFGLQEVDSVNCHTCEAIDFAIAPQIHSLSYRVCVAMYSERVVLQIAG